MALVIAVIAGIAVLGANRIVCPGGANLAVIGRMCDQPGGSQALVLATAIGVVGSAAAVSRSRRGR